MRTEAKSVSILKRLLAFPAGAKPGLFVAIAMIVVLTILADPAMDSAQAQESTLESINYAFSTQLGGGIYTVNGQTIQIYRLSPARRLKEAGENNWGYRLVVRTTLGFYNLKIGDITVSINRPEERSATFQ
jgi:hypothetical protein